MLKVERKTLIKLGMVILSASLVLGGLVGCGPSKSASVESDGPVTLKYWCPFTGVVNGVGMNSLADSDMFKELENRTKVKLEFIHPVQGQENTQLSLMLASNDLPDIIQNSFSGYSGGMRKAFEDGLIIDLSALQKEHAPNLTKAYEKYPELLMNVETDDGKIFTVPNIRGDESLLTFYGAQMRKDWLDELKLSTPTTIDEWHNVLKEFKDKKGATAPFSDKSVAINPLVSAYGIASGYFVENGKVVFGPADSRYKEYLMTINKWYKEGLIDPEFTVNTPQKLDAKIVNGQTGAFIASLGAGMKRYLTITKEKNPKFDLVAVPDAKLNSSDARKFPTRIAPALPCIVVTSANKHPIQTMKWLDYGFSKEGHMLYNFGIEGVSYTMQNGYPKYTDLITKNPNNIPMGSIAYKYMLSVNSGPFTQDKRYGEQYFELPQQADAIKTWSKDNDKALKQNTELLGTLTVSELNAIASKQTEISTYKGEFELKLVMGQLPFENYDSYINNMKKLGLDEVLQIKQAAYDRFIKRFPQALNREPIKFEKFEY